LKPVWLKPSTQEWLETDGLGGFASSTTCGIHTRRYHGWLFLPSGDPGNRQLVLSKVEDSMENADGAFDLSSNHYPGVIHPRGVDNLWAFSPLPLPTFQFKTGRALVYRRLFMLRHHPGVFCTYRVETAGLRPRDSPCTLILRPLCNRRPYHSLSREGSWGPEVDEHPSYVVVRSRRPAGSLFLSAPGAVFLEDHRLYRNMVYPAERERGLDHLEDHFSPGCFTVRLQPGHPVVFWAGPVPDDPEAFVHSLQQFACRAEGEEERRRNRIFRGAGGGLQGRLALAADQFVIRSQGNSSIVAGYHWFGEWGRDTFIALPGLLLTYRRFTEAKEVFLRFARASRDGAIPNRFEEGGGAAYNSVDSSLWFADALRKYEKWTGDSSFVEEMLPVLTRMVECFVSGSFSGVRVDPTGLLEITDAHSQLTWMDARIAVVPVTPRTGYPVEVNALWIRALTLVGFWLSRLNRPEGRQYLSLALSARKEFVRRFAWPGVGMYDRIERSGPSCELRPNQVIAASLQGLPLPGGVLRDVFLSSFKELLTPRGLRTLAPSSPAYRGRYEGAPMERDSAYHQGTAWPWLLGPFYDLWRKLRRRSLLPPQNAWLDAKVAAFLVQGLTRLDSNPCVGSIFEVASGDAPFEPGGAIAQAWSVAEVSRIVSGDIAWPHKGAT
jgi:predicted glycogen debranching enzyme